MCHSLYSREKGDAAPDECPTFLATSTHMATTYKLPSTPLTVATISFFRWEALPASA